MGWSVELCGGTHVARTGDIGLITGLSDSGVAAGVRRIEALTGSTARKYAHHLGELAKAAAAELKVPLEDMPGRLAQVLDERRRLERELSEAKKKLAMGGGARAQGADGVRVVGDVKLLARAVEGIEIKDLKSLADEGKKQLGSGVVALVATTADGKASIVVGVTPDLVARISAVDLVRRASEVLGGKGGGGKPDMAQAGGPDGSKAEAALKAIEGALGGSEGTRQVERWPCLVVPALSGDPYPRVGAISPSLARGRRSCDRVPLDSCRKAESHIVRERRWSTGPG